MFSRIAGRLRRWKNDPARLLRKRCESARGLSLVQIGANDGKTGDPLHELVLAHRDWSALFVEPVPFLFERLKQNYGADARFRFEHAAIAEASGAMDFYYLPAEAKKAAPDLPPYFDQLGSFNKAHIFAHFPGIAEELIASIRVPTLTLPELLAKHRIERLDLLAIDTEGHDWAILKQLDLAATQPGVILLEHAHLRFEERIDAMNALSRFYRIQELEGNWFCERREPGE